ncbi:hypothetical protein K474DRAFT_1667939 [Panus rudis PR-1116 ss-1]|nr:hypothetical protein K474DRAFT_1667939 [Panus rudis PR-1116 ss-1]
MSDEDFYKELEEATSKPISDESLENANKALKEASQKTLTDSIKEIQDLVSDGNDIDSRLLSAAHLIERADLPSKDEANQLRQAYVQLLWSSRSIAGSAKGAADDFAGDMLDLIMMPDVSNDEKISELVRWNNLTLLKGKDAIQQPKNFKEFVDKLRSYAAKVEKEIGDKDSDAKKKLEKLLKDIDALTQKIDSLVTNVVTPIVKFLKLAGGVFASLLSGSPQAAFTALLTAIKSGVTELQQFDKQLSDADQQRRELTAQRDKLQEQVSELEAEQERLGDASTVPATLRNIADDTVAFADRMTTFTDTFTKLSVDQQEIQDSLKQNVPVDDPMFVSHVSLLKENLAIVAKILDIYNKAPTSNVA